MKISKITIKDEKNISERISAVDWKQLCNLEKTRRELLFIEFILEGCHFLLLQTYFLEPFLRQELRK